MAVETNLVDLVWGQDNTDPQPDRSELRLEIFCFCCVIPATSVHVTSAHVTSTPATSAPATTTPAISTYFTDTSTHASFTFATSPPATSAG